MTAESRERKDLSSSCTSCCRLNCFSGLFGVLGSLLMCSITCNRDRAGCVFESEGLGGLELCDSSPGAAQTRVDELSRLREDGGLAEVVELNEMEEVGAEGWSDE